MTLCPVYFSSLFTPPSTPEIYTLSLHDALPISRGFAQAWVNTYRTVFSGRGKWMSRAQARPEHRVVSQAGFRGLYAVTPDDPDRKSTRLNSSHVAISYAVFCLKKKKLPTQ